MSTKRKRKTTIKPRLLLRLFSTIWLLVKHPTLKHHYVPFTPEQQAQYMPKTKDDEPRWWWKVDQYDLGKAQDKTLYRRMKKLSGRQARSAFRSLCTAPDAFLDPGPAWAVLLLCLLSLVMDLAVRQLPSVPVVHLKNAGSMVPGPLKALLKTVHGPEELRGKKFRLKRPCCVQAFTPLGAVAPSTQPEDYFGGYVKDYGKKKLFWLPLRNSVVAIAANTPCSAWNTVLGQSNLTVPIFCSAAPKWPNRTVLTIDGAAFHTADTDMLKCMKKQRKRIYLLLLLFERWLRGKKRRWKKYLKSAAQFYPRSGNGRFTATAITDEGRIFAVALAVFQGLLDFAVREGWLTLEDARSFLDKAWQQVLPESYPKTAADITGTAAGFWDTPDVFWGFLGRCLQENQETISLNGAPCKRNTIAVVHKLPDGEYLILSRELVAHAYADYLGQHGIAPPVEERNWEISLQRTILDWGIQVKREKKDITWRFAFYERDASPAKCKVPCLAFPLVQLPDSITNSLLEWFGADFGRWLQPQAGRNEVGPEKVMESGENE